MTKDSFLWDEFSSDPGDRGVEVIIEWKGKLLPFRIKRALTLDERQRANQAAIEIGLSDEGKPVIVKQDQAAYTKEIVLIGLKFWPFEYSPGKPVPINLKNISILDGGILDKLASHILGLVEVKKVELDPFAPKSDEA